MDTRSSLSRKHHLENARANEPLFSARSPFTPTIRVRIPLQLKKGKINPKKGRSLPVFLPPPQRPEWSFLFGSKQYDQMLNLEVA